MSRFIKFMLSVFSLYEVTISCKKQKTLRENNEKVERRKNRRIRASSHKFPINLKVQSCKLYNNKHMIASTQLTNTEIFAFISVLVFKLLSRKILYVKC